jgi:hypothetical protein
MKKIINPIRIIVDAGGQELDFSLSGTLLILRELERRGILMDGDNISETIKFFDDQVNRDAKARINETHA